MRYNYLSNFLDVFGAFPNMRLVLAFWLVKM